MDSVLRGAAIYLFLLVIFRISGRRTLAEMNPFDLVLLLIISETTQQAMLADDSSLTNCLLLVMTLLMLDILLSLGRRRWPRSQRWLEGLPMVLVEDGRPLKELMHRARVDEDDVLQSARALRGIARMDQIRYAILETTGEITIIPRERAGP